VVEGENNPCLHPGNEIQKAFPLTPDLAARFIEKALHRRGVVGWVERPGMVRMGDAVKVVVPS
jgi:hypothetical protein